jgi:uncharacterized membrane protein YdbT with pleckstrin-like domain
MSYVERNLLGDEKVIFMTKKHLIIFFIPAAVTLVALIAIPFMTHNPILRGLEWLPWTVALILWAYAGLEYWTSEFAVTNQRILMREGFFYRHASDMRLHSISQINVVQDPIGQLLKYGTISLNAFGAYDDFSYIAHANEFKNAVNEQLYKIGQG